MQLDDWKKVIDEIAENSIDWVLLRGGEVFLLDYILDLLKYIESKNITSFIDTNGTLLEKYAEELSKIKNLAITISIDGPENIHDDVRGISGTYAQIKKGVEKFKSYPGTDKPSMCFTISQFNYKFLSKMPNIARELGVKSINIVPYYYFPKSVGEAYEKLMKEKFDTNAYSWIGFHHEKSGVVWDLFQEQLSQFQKNLNDIVNFPYMDFSPKDYKKWFADADTQVGPVECNNVENLIDIQPDGNANFCVDFPDYSFGNVKIENIAIIWNSEKAHKFREYRRKNLLPICYRCGAKYITAQE